MTNAQNRAEDVGARRRVFRRLQDALPRETVEAL